MNVLVACEYSGVVREAFNKLGHNAWSCDLLPTEQPGQHYQGDIFSILEDPLEGECWDMMLAFPPCTHLAVSGASYFAEKRKDGRQQEGIDFFMKLANAKIPKIAIENPVGIMSTVWRKPDQIIQPYQFGDSISKKTCLWLKGLPKLIPTKIVGEGEFYYPKSGGRRRPKWCADTSYLPMAQRQKIRSKTFQGIANAMATQWGEVEITEDKHGN